MACTDEVPAGGRFARAVDNNRTLVIMAKAPRPGNVKTRLALSVPATEVTELYRCFLFDSIALAESLSDVDVVIMCPVSDIEELTRTVGHSVHVVGQTGDGLAAGLTSVFAKFASVGCRRVIAFNSDTPHLPASVLKEAFELLATCDLVIGPTHDGGYYLVGAKAFHPDLFAGNSMGTKNALEVLLAQGRSLGLSLQLTSAFYDVDVLADLSRLIGELQLDPGKAPRTARWLLERGITVLQGEEPAKLDQ
jgi:uncharacterized protein